MVIAAEQACFPQLQPRFVDLAEKTEFQTVVDREKGQYLGHVSSVLLEDGKTILISYPQGHGKGPVVLKRSEDGGKTWSERLTTPKSFETSLETPTIHRVFEPLTGKKRLILWSGLYPARRALSEDDGRTWTELEKVGDWGGIVVMGSVVPISGGRYRAYFHDDGRFFTSKPVNEGKFTLYDTTSGDGGKTWSAPRALLTRTVVHLCEPGIVRSPNGDQLAMLLRENRRVKNSHIMFSRDEGESWTRPAELPKQLTGDRHTAKYAPDGRLVISFRDMAEGPTKGDWVAWVGTWKDLVEGKPGQYKIRLMDNKDSWDCAYPGVEVLPDGTVVAMTYGHWTSKESPYIIAVRFKLEQIDAMALGR